jgi:hypothetical protein
MGDTQGSGSGESQADLEQASGVRVPAWLLFAGAGLLIVLVVVLAVLLLRDGPGGSATTASDEASQSTDSPQEVLDKLRCDSPANRGASGEVAASVDCGDADIDFVYFFNSQGDESLWVNRVNQTGGTASIVAGPGWAVESYDHDRLAAGIDLGGTQVR